MYEHEITPISLVTSISVFQYIFLMEHFLHLNKLWTIYHFMSIQTTYVASI